jgi:predicted RNA binding protein YcfA (HicA-like mRNA interferase family)
MKRTDLIRTLESAGCILIRHGGNHDWYRNPKTGNSQPIPRHREIKEFIAKHILKILAS